MKFKNALYILSISIFSLVSLKIDDFLESYITNRFFTIVISIIIFVTGIILINKLFKDDDGKNI